MYRTRYIHTHTPAEISVLTVLSSQVVGEVYTTWLDGLPGPELLRSLLTTFTTLLRQALSGRPDHTPSPTPGSLHCAQALVGGGGGGGGEGGVTFAEHEAAAQVMLMEKDSK